MVELKPVTSSNIKAIGHDPETKEIHVQFHSGATHAYEDCCGETYAKLIGAKSIGSHFHAHVRSKKSRRVDKPKDDVK